MLIGIHENKASVHVELPSALSSLTGINKWTPVLQVPTGSLVQRTGSREASLGTDLLL